MNQIWRSLLIFIAIFSINCKEKQIYTLKGCVGEAPEGFECEMNIEFEGNKIKGTSKNISENKDFQIRGQQDKNGLSNLIVYEIIGKEEKIIGEFSGVLSEDSFKGVVNINKNKSYLFLLTDTKNQNTVDIDEDIIEDDLNNKSNIFFQTPKILTIDLVQLYKPFKLNTKNEYKYDGNIYNIQEYETNYFEKANRIYAITFFPTYHSEDLPRSNSGFYSIAIHEYEGNVWKLLKFNHNCAGGGQMGSPGLLELKYFWEEYPVIVENIGGVNMGIEWGNTTYYNPLSLEKLFTHDFSSGALRLCEEMDFHISCERYLEDYEVGKEKFIRVIEKGDEAGFTYNDTIKFDGGKWDYRVFDDTLIYKFNPNSETFTRIEK